MTEAKNIWHSGEVAIQASVGSAERLALHGKRIFLDHLNPQHRGFYPRLPFLLAGAVDRAGDVWATVLAGRPGFAAAPDPYRLSIASARIPGDPADAGMENGDAVALLGIELHTRRRNRLNGSIQREGAERFDVVVGQAYGNCPQYIHLRGYEFVREPGVPATGAPKILPTLDQRAQAMIRSADTFFVASYVDREGGPRQVDISHRGGPAGFVRLGEDGVLTIPDFSGNQFFNTLGNILVNRKSGLLFIDFMNGDLLQLSGESEIIFDSPQIATFAGAERLWRFTPRRIVYRPDALPLRWTPGPND